MLVKDQTGSGEPEFAEIKAATHARAVTPQTLLLATNDDRSVPLPPLALQLLSTKSCEKIVSTPPGWRGNPDPKVVHNATVLPTNERRIPEPAGISKRDPRTLTLLALPPRTELASIVNGSLPVMYIN